MATSDNDLRRSSIELLREAANDRRLAGEVVTLELRTDGALVLRAQATGLAVEMIMGDGLNDSVSWWTVAANQVPRVLAAAVRDLFPDTPALRDWMASRGIAAADDGWQGYDVRPIDESRFLLEALRDVIGTTVDWDEGQRIAARLVDWLSRNGIHHDYREQVGEAY